MLGGGGAPAPAAPTGIAAGTLGGVLLGVVGAMGALGAAIPLEEESRALSAAGPLAAIVGALLPAAADGVPLGLGVTLAGELMVAWGNDADSESPAQPTRPANANTTTQDSNFRIVGSSPV
jgi:hypothetical protein